MRYVVRLDGALVPTTSGRASFAFREVAELFAADRSLTTYRDQLLTVHDGDAITEGNVVAVYRNGTKVGPTLEDHGY